MGDSPANGCGEHVPNGSIHGAPDLALRQAGSGCRPVIQCRPHPNSVSDNLSGSAQNPEQCCEDPVERVCRAQTETQSTNGAGQRVTPESQLRFSPGRARVFPTKGYAVSCAAGDPKNGPKRDPVPYAEQQAVGDTSGQCPERPVFAA